MKTLVCFFACLALSVSLGAADPDAAAKKALSQIEGDWKMVSGSADGMEMPEGMRNQMKRTFKGNELTVTMGGQPFFKARITVDPSKTPMTIDYEMTEGVTKGQKQLGIYEMDGDTFKSSFAKPNLARPADFKPAEGRTVSVWKREGKKD